MLPALIRRHPHHEWILHLAFSNGLAPPDNRVVQEHRSDHQQDQNHIDQPHPSHYNRADVPRMNAILKVHAGQRKLLRHALVTLAAGRVQMRLVDRRSRIARRQNIVHAMAARAIRSHHRTALGSQPVVAVKVAVHSVSRHAKLLRKPHAFVAARAGIARKILLRDWRVGIHWRFDGVNPVAVRAHRSQLIATRNRLPVNALIECVFNLRVALAAGGRNACLVDRRFGIARGQNLVRPMAIRAHRGLLRAVLHGPPMHALLVGEERLVALPIRLHQKLLPVASAACRWDVAVIHRRFWVIGCQNLVRPAVAILAVGRLRVPWRSPAWRAGCESTPPARPHGTEHRPPSSAASRAPGCSHPCGSPRTQTSSREWSASASFHPPRAYRLAVHVLGQRTVGVAPQAVLIFELMLGPR